MSVPEEAPTRTLRTSIVLWVVAGIAAVLIGLFVPVDWRMAWMTVALGAGILLAFCVHLWGGRSKGFIDRVALSTGGMLLVMGIVSALFAVAAMIPGSVLPR